MDENTLSKCNMDIARLMIRVPCSFQLKEHMEMDIDGEEYLFVLREETYDHVRIVRQKSSSKRSSPSSSNSGESCSNNNEDLISEKLFVSSGGSPVSNAEDLAKSGRRVGRRRLKSNAKGWKRHMCRHRSRKRGQRLGKKLHLSMLLFGCVVS